MGLQLWTSKNNNSICGPGKFFGRKLTSDSDSAGPKTRTPENPPKCIFPGPGKFLSFGADVCANPGTFGLIFDKMYMSNPGNCQGRMKVCVIIRVQSGGRIAGLVLVIICL